MVADSLQALPLLPARYQRTHLPEPDFSRPHLELRPEQRARVVEKLTVLYGEQRAEACYAEVERLMKVYHAHKTPEMLAEQVRRSAARARE